MKNLKMAHEVTTSTITCKDECIKYSREIGIPLEFEGEMHHYHCENFRTDCKCSWCLNNDKPCNECWDCEETVHPWHCADC